MVSYLEEKHAHSPELKFIPASYPCGHVIGIAVGEKMPTILDCPLCRPKLKSCGKPAPSGITHGFRHYCTQPQGHPGVCRSW